MITMAMMMTAIILPLPALATGGADGMLDSFIPLRSQPCLERKPGPRPELGRGGRFGTKNRPLPLRRPRTRGRFKPLVVEEYPRASSGDPVITPPTKPSCGAHVRESLNPQAPACGPAMDYKALGLRCGLEVHQQLDTHKLFCACPSGLSEKPEGTFLRRLRPTVSELGEVDAAAIEEGKRIGIPTILLEEDAARKVSEAEGEVVYRLDRLGIPLVEIATTPDIASPEEAAKVALGIGSWLRATRRVMRGIGTIREDLNVSIRGGSRIEIKGVQELRMIPIYVEKEVERQIALIEAVKELKARGVSHVDLAVQDLSSVLKSSSSKVVRGALDVGGRVLGARIPCFRGLLKGRLGPEFAAHARVAGVRGILHSDELPGYGVTAEEVDAIAMALRVSGTDAFVLVADDEVKARRAFEEMLPRIRAAVAGVPEETRDPRPDGSTVYSRPLPEK